MNTPSVDDIVNIVNQLEGPYKWYVLGVILVVLTAIMTKVIFKTFKWFLIIVAFVVVAGAVAFYLIPDILPL